MVNLLVFAIPWESYLQKEDRDEENEEENKDD